MSRSVSPPPDLWLGAGGEAQSSGQESAEACQTQASPGPDQSLGVILIGSQYL